MAEVLQVEEKAETLQESLGEAREAGAFAISRPVWVCGLRQLKKKGRECSEVLAPA